MGDRCTGRCCRKFTIPEPLQIRGFAAAAALAGHHANAAENAQIADMVLWSHSEPDPRGEERFGRVDFWTCKHLLPSGDCGAYEARPTYMCGAFPYGRPCPHGVECEWDYAREGYHQGAKLRGLRQIVSGELAKRAAKVRLPLLAAPRGVSS